MPKLKNPFAAAAAFAERLSDPDHPLPLPRRSLKAKAEEVAESKSAAPEAQTDSPAEAAAPAEPAPKSAPAEGKPALHQPKILKEYVIPVADDTPEAITFSSFSDEETEEETPDAVPAEEAAIPEIPAEPSPDNPLRRNPRPVKPGLPEELSSNLWALSILLGVACTVVAFFVGAFS